MIGECKLGQTVEELLGKIREGVKVFLVKDEKGNYVGLLTDDIILRMGFNLKAKIDSHVIKLKPAKDMKEAIEKMINANVRAALLENGQVITIYDALKEISDEEFLNKEVSEIMHEKVYTIDSKESISKAIAIMKKKGVSRLIVLEDGKPVGIVTASDIVKHFYEKQRGTLGGFYDTVGKIEVRSIMSVPLIYVNPSDKIKRAIQILCEKEIFALPVIDDSKIKGMISAKDILAAYLSYLKKEEYRVVVHGIKIDEIDYQWIKKRFEERILRKYSDIIGEEPMLILHVKKTKEEKENRMIYFVVRAKLIGSKARIYVSDEGYDLYSTLTKVFDIIEEELEKKKGRYEREYLWERILKEGL